MSNYISAEISPEKVTEVLNLIAQIKDDLPFLIKLDNNTKKSMVSLDDGRTPFVTKGLQYALKESKIVPPFVDVDELKKDFTLFSDLQNISRELNRLADMLNDTRIAAGTDAYVATLSIYNSAKQAAKMNVPGTQAIVDDLKKVFDGQGATTTTATTAKE